MKLTSYLGRTMAAAWACVILTQSLHADFESGIADLATQITTNLEAEGKQRVAVLEFADLNGDVSHFGQFLAEELITQLFVVSPGKFDVVERRQLTQVMAEHKLGATGLLNPDTIKQLGQFLAVDAVVTGSIVDLGNDIKINARLISVETAKIFSVSQVRIPKVGTVADLLAKSAGQTTVGDPPLLQERQQKLKPPPAPTGAITTRDIRFELLSVTKSGDSIKAQLRITALKEDLRLKIYGTYNSSFSRIIDPFGNVARAKQSQLGSKDASTYATSDLIREISTAASLVFPATEQPSEYLQVLEVSCESGNVRFPVQFRNVPVTVE
ncbi:FlgO family outer membrane protein [Actomonas aquatica]|uniref:FlgO family outer membrane protein n=1 Tax=Actomonas aquatica TaxID=2866162 RepID=A0ABZ1C6B2_9BACT|nr:FlgO family outer membrane protein [Opitutus sp. WL0086]WRQ87190.1 FlgO family outer membrane protein [Opitutus sp. WL0086]